LRTSENRVLRRISGPKKEKGVGGLRRLHNEELHDFYNSPDIIRVIKSRMRWVGYGAQTGEMRNAYIILVGKPEGKQPLGTPRHTWENNIRLELREIGWGGGGADQIHLAQDRDQWQALVNMVIKLWVPQTVSFSRKTMFHGVSLVVPKSLSKSKNLCNNL
jgi:hypothetical protein